MQSSYLIIDPELKSLFQAFDASHPEGSKTVLKLVLKMYLKLMEKCRKKGTDPLLILQNLVERVASGRLYETTKDKIDHLNLLLEEGHSPAGLASDSALVAELRELKGILRERPLMAGGSKTMEDFAPTDGPKLVKIQDEGPKKRENYREMRKQRQQKKISF